MAKKFARIIIAIAGALIGLAATAGADKLLCIAILICRNRV